jgi:LDH2 family malate/lactate/ureidoglycolate dehydrogenase
MPEVAVNHYPRPLLIQFAIDYLRKLGASQEEAEIVADGIVTAAARWHPGKGQGLEKFDRLTVQCGNGGIVPGAPFEILKESPAVAHVDAHKGFGYVTGTRAMRLAIDKARQTGTGSVLVRHSNHFGQAGYHAETATKAGMIGIAMTNASSEMAPWGGKKAVLGTNPWGLGIPRGGGNPILLDMALTTSGQGMVRWAYRESQPVPDNWMLTAEGKRSANPADFLAPGTLAVTGTQYPIGEFKGYGLSLFTDVITGVLSGSLFGLSCFVDMTNHDVGHFFLALNPDFFMTREEFNIRLEQLIAEVKGADPIEPGGEIYLPGELEFRNEERALSQTGIPIDVVTVQRLRELAVERGVSCPL